MDLRPISSRRLRVALLGLAAACLATVATADKVILKNGNVMEGIVVSESAREIVLSVGVGKVNIRRSKIRAIQRSDAAETKSIQSEWRDKYFDHPDYAPPGFADVIRKLKGLYVLRRRAAAAERAGAAAVAKQKETEKGYLELQAQLAATSRDLFAASPLKDAEAYNRLVARSNELRSLLVIKEQEMREGREALVARADPRAEYMQELAAFEAMFAERVAAYGKRRGGDVNQVFLDGMAKRVAQFRADFTVTQIEPQRVGNSVIVRARINGAGDGRFIFDTGAAIVTLSADLAKRLALDLTAAKSIPLTLADGRQVQGRTVTLGSVQVGDARAENVRAVVLDFPPGPGVDGLLGMSFLKEFNVNYNAENNQLVLRQFTPR